MSKSKLSEQNQAVMDAVPWDPLGISGLNFDTTGYVWDEWLEDLRGTQNKAKRFREMSENNPVCGSMDHALRTWMGQTPISFEAADESPQADFIRAFIETVFDDMSMTWQETMSDITSEGVHGFSYHELVLKLRRGLDNIPELRSSYNDGLVGIRKIPIRHQETIVRWEFDDDGDVMGAYQQAPPVFKETFIPLTRAALFRTRSNKNNPEGYSLFRPAYRPWFFLKRIEEYEAIGIAKDLAGELVFRVPPQYFSEKASDAQKQTKADLKRSASLAQRGKHSGIVYPAADDPQGKTGWDVHLLQSGGRKPIDTDPIVKRLESRIAIAALSEAVLLGMQGNVGSWSLADMKFRMSTLAMRALLNGIADVFNRFIIPQIVAINGWPPQLSPKLVFGDIDTGNMLEALPAITAAVTGGILTVGPKIEEHVRATLGIPPEDEPSLGQMQDAAGEFGEMSGPEQDAQSAGALQETVPIQAEQESALSMDEIARDYGVSRRMIRSAAERGDLPGLKFGRQWRFNRAEVAEWKARRFRRLAA